MLSRRLILVCQGRRLLTARLLRCAVGQVIPCAGVGHVRRKHALASRHYVQAVPLGNADLLDQIVGDAICDVVDAIGDIIAEVMSVVYEVVEPTATIIILI